MPELGKRGSIYAQLNINKLAVGDSHTAALTELGAVYSWGVFRGNSGPFAFLPGTPFALGPVLVYAPHSTQSQLVQISSGRQLILST